MLINPFNQNGLIGGPGSINEHSDTVMRFTCKRAHDENKLHWPLNADAAFVNQGFCSWKDACKKFNVHQNSKAHEEAVLKVVIAPSSM